MSDISLDDRVAIVTGASRNLGLSMAKALASAGARVVLASPEEELLAAAVHDITQGCGDGRAISVKTDITSEEDCENLLARAISEFGGVDVLVNNARRFHSGPGLPPQGNATVFWESDRDIWRETINVNVNGTFLLSHTLAPHLISRGWGRIINITTSLGTLQRKNNSPYGVSKAALEAATLIWAQDLEGTGVTVNSLIPGGRVAIDRTRPVKPGQKLLPVEIMNEAVVWLASPLSDGQTGGRYVGMNWDGSLPPSEAAAKARELPVFRPHQ